jgi:uncharacterized membrane protein YfcA
VSLLQLLAITVAAAVGSGVNSIAGGGTLITFPTIVWLGVPPLVANATSTVALWPGALGSMWGYRGELGGARAWAIRFAVPSLLGGAVGAWLLLVTSPRAFDRIVPFLVLGATLLFVLRDVFRTRQAGAPGEPAAHREPAVPPLPYLVAQFAVGVYGGYFGAGIGILMLAALGAMGLTNIHRMNGLKNWGGLCINLVAALMFAMSGIVNWPVAGAMAVGGTVGGYGAARLAQRVGQAWVRRAVVVVGFASFAWLLARGW